MSSIYSHPRHGELWPASNAIDGKPVDDYFSLCATKKGTNQWLSVRVPTASRVGYVAVYNREDKQQYMEWLSPFEVWVGNHAGDVTSSNAVRCGNVQYVDTSKRHGAPFVVACPPNAIGEYVTIRLVRWARYLTIAELEVYSNELRAASVSASQRRVDYDELQRALPNSPELSLSTEFAPANSYTTDDVLRSEDNWLFGALGVVAILVACTLIGVLYLVCVHRRAAALAPSEANSSQLKRVPRFHSRLSRSISIASGARWRSSIGASVFPFKSTRERDTSRPPIKWTDSSMSQNHQGRAEEQGAAGARREMSNVL